MATRAVKTAISGAGENKVEVCAAIDDDPATFAALQTASLRGFARITYYDELRGCSRAWNDALRLATGDTLVLAGDDLVFEDGWLDAALAALEEHPGHLIGFNDGHWGEELSTHYLMPRDFVVDVLGGVVAWECYGHGYNDREANARARAANRYHWCEAAKVRHEHWTYGERVCDDTDTRNLARLAESEANFNRRAAEGFPDEVIA